MDIPSLKDTIKNTNYICIRTDGLISIHPNQRDIASYYKINHSTVSKAFNKDTICSCKSKTYGTIVIRKLCSTPID